MARLALAASMLVAFPIACAATSDGSGTAGGAGAGGSDFDPSSSSAGGGDGFDACAVASDDAKLVPVNLYIMFDKSGSMIGARWADSTSAMQSFFMSPESAGLRVALRFFPDAGCDASCNVTPCAEPRVPLGELTELSAPTDAHEQLLLDAFGAVSPGGGTPLYAAYEGALEFATQTARDNPGEKAAVVLVTDGEPSDCDDAVSSFTDAGHAARVNEGVTTFAIGLEGASESLLNAIASAGGTGQGIFIGSGKEETELLAALEEIRASTIACTYEVPESAGGEPVDPNRVNVLILPSGATEPITIGQVPDAASCTDDQGGWYYDDNAAPTQIHLCPATCEAAQSDPGAEIELLFGCKSVAQ